MHLQFTGPTTNVVRNNLINSVEHSQVAVFKLKQRVTLTKPESLQVLYKAYLSC